MNLKQLGLLSLAYNRSKHPSVPAHALTSKSYSDKTANGLTNSIIDFCKFNGILAWRQNTQGVFRPGQTVVDVIGRTRHMKGSWQRAAKSGLGDITIVHNGRMISVEIKIGRDVQRESQIEFEQELNAAGGLYQIISSWDQWYTFYWGEALPYLNR